MQWEKSSGNGFQVDIEYFGLYRVISFNQLLKIESGSQECNQSFSHQQVPFPIRVKAVLQKIFFKNTSVFV
jgi:hypothetical protein